MKKSSIWILVIVIIIIIVGAVWYISERAPVSNNGSTGTASSTGPTAMGTAINYYCDSGIITATYSASAVSLKLSDGRTFNLPQAVSGSGIRYESGVGTSEDLTFESEGNDAFFIENGTSTYNDCVAGSEMAMGSNTMYSDPTNLFTVTYPNEFTLTGGGVGFTQSWRAGATSSGILLAQVTIPPSFEPKTNFVNAVFTFGTSADPGAVASCLTDTGGLPAKTSQVTINGVAFTKLSFTDVGAGQIYDTTSYRTVKNDQCYSADYTIHSGNINNYPTNTGISAFDEAKVQNILIDIVASLKFLK